MPEANQNPPRRSTNDLLVWRVRHDKQLNHARHVGHVYSLHAADHREQKRPN